MDGSESGLELDWDAIEKNAELYDTGECNDNTIVAKLLMMAYEHGFDDGILESEVNHRHTQLLLFGEAGHA